MANRVIFNLIILSGLVSTVLAQDPAVNVRVDVPVVSVSVVVQDEDSRPISSLTSSDFAIFENGERQEIRHFVAPDPSPHSILLMFDVSGSMAYFKRSMEEVIPAFARTLGQEYRFAVGSFEDKFRMLIDWRNLSARQQLSSRLPEREIRAEDYTAPQQVWDLQVACRGERKISN